MRFPKSTHFEDWRLAFADSGLPTSSERRGLNVLIAITAVGGLIASGALGVAEDPRPLDVQLASAMRDASATLKTWEQQLSRGLQVSMRAVADGRDTPPAPQPVAIATPAALTAPVLQPVR